MSIIDWTIVAVFLVGINIIGIACRKYMKSVSDWLVAGRGVGRYLGVVADTGQGVGAISIIAILQLTYAAGPAYFWIYIQTLGLGLIIAITGWGIYRLRETKVMTLNELLERRYSRRFRIFCGFLCFVSGVINMGIFPIIEGRFVVYFCQLPRHFDLFGISIQTIPAITGLLVFVSVLFCFVGGQISIVVTDFIQTSIIMLMFVAVGFAVYSLVTWDHVEQALHAQENMADMVNPIRTTAGNKFNIWFFGMTGFAAFYNILSWSPSMVRGQSARDPREAKIMILVSYLRLGLGVALYCFVPIACFAFMRLPIFADKAAAIQNTLNGISNVKVQDQMIVPIFLTRVLPVGMVGLFLVGMLAASISTLDSYFLSWTGVFIQDVVMPFRKKPLTQMQHMWLLKAAVIGIAVFVYLFGIFYKETDYIVMFMYVTGAIYTGGAGTVILGALYWRRGTTAGAWAAMITGSAIAGSGIVLGQIWGKIPFLAEICEKFPLDGLRVCFIASIASITMYVFVSLLTRKKKFDLDGLLNRKDGVNVEVMELKQAASGNWFVRHMYHILWVIAIILIIISASTIWYNLTYQDTVNPENWLKFWKLYVFGFFFWTIPATMWLIAGGIRDLYRFFKHLKTEVMDEKDDGFVRSGTIQ
ncbi:MAG: sodium:solute symporter family protein [Planctomycetota bacterium]